MFDPATAAFLRSAPGLPGLDPADLPQLLTERYAELVARRLRRTEGEEGAAEEEPVEWPLSRVADTYELIASIQGDAALRRAAAFVAGTAQQILSQETSGHRQATPALSRDHVDPSITAAVLFLASEQYADAHEASRLVRTQGPEQSFIATLLAENLQDLTAGNLRGVLDRAARRPGRLRLRGSLEARSTDVLFESLLVGVELFAAEVLGEPIPERAAGRFDTARAAFAAVLKLSTALHATGDAAIGSLLTSYPGPRHLASLLLAAYDSTAGAALTRLDPPPGSDAGFWDRWLRHRAATAPFVWPNHREAVGNGFHLVGNSAVLILPTGAGKTTVSCLKIAGVLASGKSVIFIAPTHALVDQLREDLQAVFPEDLLGSLVSSDFDRLFAIGSRLQRIEVMTPEHCLALLSFAPEAFEDVGLLVFDECHLLSPQSGMRRALDGMFCVLAFNSIAPDADLLFLSAMLRNGEDFARWIESLTSRTCVFVDPLWKPSRQARGVVFYNRRIIQEIRRAALVTQRELDRAQGRNAKTLRAGAAAKLNAEPFALFGLQHNWLQEGAFVCAIKKLSDTKVRLGGEFRGGTVLIKPNVNKVAAQLAAAAARNNLKSIVFVNVKSHAVSTARNIAAALGAAPEPTGDEAERWTALEVELGGLAHSILSGPSLAVPHNADMLRLERDLAERMFRRPDGAKVIVATPTLAQGLNLPAHLAILASDMRADPEDGGREALAAHEILNAAARAGRAGHLANGVVLLIPEDVLTFAPNMPISPSLVSKLRSVLPEDDRCLDMSDPLQVILDRITEGAYGDLDVDYALNRLSTALAPEGAESEASTHFSIQKSLAAFMAKRRDAAGAFDEQVARLNALLNERNIHAGEGVLLELAAQSGASISALRALRDRLAANPAGLPRTISDWLSWVFEWLLEDSASRHSLLNRERRAILGAVGRRASEELTSEAWRELYPGALAWISGEPLCEIERALGGEPNNPAHCPRARKLVSGIVPLALSFIFGLVGRVVQALEQSIDDIASPRSVTDCLGAAVRRGFDTPSKLAFADLRKGLLSRVQYHMAYTDEIGEELELADDDDYGMVAAKLRNRLAAKGE